MNENDEALAIEIPKTPAYLQQSKYFSDFIQSLPLSTADNDKLIHRLMNYTDCVRRDSFLLGYRQALRDMSTSQIGSKA